MFLSFTKSLEARKFHVPNFTKEETADIVIGGDE